MLTLGIETSCDETGLALVRDGALLDQALATQADMHSLFGGVVPEMASREHYRLLGPLLDKLLARNSLDLASLDAVAVARGPGLLGSLLVGLGLAKGLAFGLGKPLVGVNHLHAHLLAVGLERELIFPALGLLVSGGHTHLYRLDSPLEIELLGRTLDDAAGEAFDKVAKMLNLPYPGGKYLDQLARRGSPDPGRFPRPYLDNQNLDFSFSGLKTAVAEDIKRHQHLRFERMPETGEIEALAGSMPELADFCASFNLSVAETLKRKSERALKGLPEIKAVIVAGGVAANGMVREAMAELADGRGLQLLLPGFELCTDNAAMVAYAGELLARAGLRHGADLEAVPRGRPVPWDFLSATGRI